jgi:hypothetical protein
MKYLIFLFIVSITISLQAQTNLRDVGSFSQVKASGNLEVILIQSNQEGVNVIRDHDQLKIDRKGNVLKISVDKVGQLFKNNDPAAKVEVHYSHITELNASAGVDVMHDGILEFNSMELRFASGAQGDFELEGKQLLARAGEGAILKISGEVERFEAKSASGGHLKARGLAAEEVDADACTGGMTSVYAIRSINADAHTGGAIDYKGKPSKHNIKESLGGSVKGN